MTRHPEPRFLSCGDSAVTIELADSIDPAVSEQILGLDAALAALALPGVVEIVPTYRSLMVHFDPLHTDYEGLVAHVRRLLGERRAVAGAGRRWRIPVVYGGDYGMDLEEVAARHGLTPSQVIDRHAGAVYRVYMIGFMPGFTYLGGLDPSLATSRRPDPRPVTPSQSISIGGIQALVTGQAMPSGWHFLGRTPVRTFLPSRQPIFLLEPGDEVVFEPIAARLWDELDRRAAAGEPVAEIVPGGGAR